MTSSNQCDQVLAQVEPDWARPTADLTKLVDVIMGSAEVSRGMARGRLSLRPDTGVISLQDLIDYARNELARRQ